MNMDIYNLMYCRTHIQPCPTLPYHSPPRSRRDSSASLPCPTSAYPSLPQPTPSYTVAFCRPNLVLHGILLRSSPDATQQPSPRLAPLAGMVHGERERERGRTQGVSRERAERLGRCVVRGVRRYTPGMGGAVATR